MMTPNTDSGWFTKPSIEMNKTYYAQRLSGHGLDRVYEIAGSRVRQYLAAEIAHVREAIRSGDWILELGCGTGRVLAALSEPLSAGLEISRPYSGCCGRKGDAQGGAGHGRLLARAGKITFKSSSASHRQPYFEVLQQTGGA
jgi:hypothetical protein